MKVLLCTRSSGRVCAADAASCALVLGLSADSWADECCLHALLKPSQQVMGGRLCCDCLSWLPCPACAGGVACITTSCAGWCPISAAAVCMNAFHLVLQDCQLTEYEAAVFVPCLIEKAGHNQVSCWHNGCEQACTFAMHMIRLPVLQCMPRRVVQPCVLAACGAIPQEGPRVLSCCWQEQHKHLHHKVDAVLCPADALHPTQLPNWCNGLLGP